MPRASRHLLHATRVLARVRCLTGMFLLELRAFAEDAVSRMRVLASVLRWARGFAPPGWRCVTRAGIEQGPEEFPPGLHQEPSGLR